MFNKPAQKWHCKDIACVQHQRLCILCVDFWGCQTRRQCYYSDRLNSFAAEAIEGLHRFFELLLVVAHFFEGWWKEYFCLAAIVD
jgi:hypothetical protein